MPCIHLVEGPVGAGKSTFAFGLCQRHAAPHLNLDDWMVTLFRPDRPATDVVPWYQERKDRCIEQIWKVACEIVESGSDVVLELGLIQRAARQAFYERVDVAGYDLDVYVLDVPRDVRRERVRLRNRTQGATFAMEVPDEIFEFASNLWEPPDALESSARRVHVISESRPHADYVTRP